MFDTREERRGAVFFRIMEGGGKDVGVAGEDGA